jgi:hypothetical protein
MHELRQQTQCCPALLLAINISTTSLLLCLYNINNPITITSLQQELSDLVVVVLADIMRAG